MARKFKTLLLAGGKSKPALYKVTGQKYKALMTINAIDPRPIVYHMIEVLQKTKYISQLYIASPEEVQEELTLIKDIMLSPSGISLMDTLKLNMPQFTEETYILIATCDLPMVQNQHIEHFIEKCLVNPGFDIYYSVIKKDIYTRAFPCNDLRRIYANLVEGTFTGGNLFLINPKIVSDCAKTIEQFILFRKHPLKMAKILGNRIVIKYLKKCLSIRELEKLVPHFLKGYTGKAILADPEIALDIDKPIQLEALKSQFRTS
ncbi:MAG: NTP transferase domain-containing protein [Atribacterota bacterium]